MDLGDVKGQTILDAKFEDKDFEEFFKRLLMAELELRHRADADIKGPVAKYRGDDLRDLVFITNSAPRQIRADFWYALTWDAQSTWYSCKSGGSWRGDILGELGQAAYNKFRKTKRPPSRSTKKRPPDLLLEHLAKGRRYVFVVADPGVDDRGLCDEAAKVLAFWLRQTGRKVPRKLREQLEFIDGSRIANFIATHRPTTLTEAQRTKLGVDDPAGLKLWAQWTSELSTGRELPAFEGDPLRAEVFAAVADPQVTMIRVFGPPGVGKTRLVHEAIECCAIEGARERTRFTQDFELSRDIVESPWLRRGGAHWLVLDELRSIDVDRIVEKFHANAQPGARLFMIGTSDDQSQARPGTDVRSFELAPLDSAQTERVVRAEGPALADAQVEVICHLSEGYPWYAVLLAKAVDAGDHTLERGDNDATRWGSGALRVLAGNPTEHADEGAWKRRAELRAKALLVAMLTRNLELDWETLWERYGEALRLAIDEPNDWHEVKRSEKDCRERQILRMSGASATRRYVSPNNLARLILHHFLTDPDLGPKIRRHTPELRGELAAIARKVQVNPKILDGLMRGEWQELERRAAQDGVAAVEAYLSRTSSASYEAALELPEIAAEAMAALVRGWTSEQLLAAPNAREVARFVFAHALHRKISTGTFQRIEQALLRLANFDERRFANGARGVWSSLFLSVVHSTYQPWDIRLARLDDALADEDPFVQSLAVDALVRCVEPREQGLGHTEDDRRDGEWPTTTTTAIEKAQLWARLLSACEGERPSVEAARAGVASRLRSGIGRGLFADHLQRLANQIANWTASQRQRVVEAIIDIRRYDLDELADFDELLAGLDAIERAAAPNDLRERVRAQIASWHPGPWPINDPARPEHEAAGDLRLADALLADPAALEWALEWCRTSEAHRASALWYALGRADGSRALLDRLVDTTPPAPSAVANYLLGWAQVSSAGVVETWMQGLEPYHGRAIGGAMLQFLAQQPPSSERLQWISAIVDQRIVDGRAFVLLGHRGWIEASDPDTMVSLIEALGEQVGDDPVLVDATLWLIAKLLGRPLSDHQRERLFAVAIPIVRRGLASRIPIGTQPSVTEIVLRLVATGRAEIVTQLLITALDTDGSNIHLGHALIDEVVTKGQVERIWPQLAAALESAAHPELLAWQLAHHRLSSALPVPTVLDWVGSDARRGRIAASITSPHADSLDAVARELLLRFGPDGPVAEVLRSRALSTPGAVAGEVMTFERRQLGHVRAWLADTSPHVQQWARALESILAQRIDEHEARREFRRKFG